MAGNLNRLDSGVSRAFAKFAIPCEWDELRSTVQHDARRHLVNWSVCVPARWRNTAPESARRVFSRINPREDCTVTGQPVGAAPLSAIAANMHDYDDTHTSTGLECDGAACRPGRVQRRSSGEPGPRRPSQAKLPSSTTPRYQRRLPS